MGIGDLFRHENKANHLRSRRRRSRTFDISAHVEHLEERTLLSAANGIIADAFLNFDNASITTPDPDLDALVIDSITIDGTTGSGLNINLDTNISDISALNTIIIRNVNITNNAGVGLNIRLVDMELDSLLIEKVTIDGNNGVGLNLFLDGTTINNLTVQDSSFTDDQSGPGIWVNADGSTLNNTTFQGNTVTGNAGDGMLFDLDNASTAPGLTIANNTAISNNGGNGLSFLLQNRSPLADLVIDNNTINANTGGDGISFHINDAADTVDGGSDGLPDFDPGSNISGLIDNNTITNHSNGNGVSFTRTDPPSAADTFWVDVDITSFSGNTVNGNSGAGVYANLPRFTTFDSALTGNTISNNGNAGFSLTVIETVNAFDVTIGGLGTGEGNTINNNRGAGVLFTLNDTGTGQFSTTGSFEILGNTINNTRNLNSNFQGDAIRVLMQGVDVVLNGKAALFSSTIDANTIESNAGRGIYIDVKEDSTVTDLMIGNDDGNADQNGNQIRNNSSDGIRFLREDNTELTNIDIYDNIVDNNNGDGLDLRLENAPYVHNFTVNYNEFTNNNGRGLLLHTGADSILLIDLKDNLIDGNSSHGIELTGEENDPSDQENIGGTWIKNTISDNGGSGIRVNTVHGETHPLIIGKVGTDPTDFRSLGNLIDGNTSSGIELNGGNNGSSALGLVGLTRIDNNLITNNGSHGVDINDTSPNYASSPKTVEMHNNVIAFNGGDGLEIQNESGGVYSYPTLLHAGLRLIALGNTIDRNEGRGVDILNQYGGDAIILFGDGTTAGKNNVRSNKLEGFYVVNTASLTQNQTDAATTALNSDGDINWNPSLNLELDNNEIKQNGVNSNFSGTGLVIRVGSTDSYSSNQRDYGNEADGYVNGNLSANNEYISMIGGNIDANNDNIGDGVGTEAGVGGIHAPNSWISQVSARVENNAMSGNFGVDVLIESFTSTVDPTTTTGTWTDADYNISNTTYRRDPLARLNLTFTGNSGDSIDVTRSTLSNDGNSAGALYDNSEGEWKSRSTSADPDGAFNATRERNATRLADRPIYDTNGNLISWGRPNGDNDDVTGTDSQGWAEDDLSWSIASITVGDPYTTIRFNPITFGGVSTGVADLLNGMIDNPTIVIADVQGVTAVNGTYEKGGLANQWSRVDANTIRIRKTTSGTVTANGNMTTQWFAPNPITGITVVNDASTNFVDRWELTSVGHGLSDNALIDVTRIYETGFGATTDPNGTHVVEVINDDTIRLIDIEADGSWDVRTGSNPARWAKKNPDTILYDGLANNNNERNSTFRVDESGNSFTNITTNFDSSRGIESTPETGELSYIWDRVDAGTFTNALLSVSDATIVTEPDTGNTFAVFDVTLRGSYSQDVTVYYQTNDGTATTADGDYQGLSLSPLNSLTWSGGANGTQQVSVQINGDTAYERDETFYLLLAFAENASIVSPRAIGTIANNDPLPYVSVNDVTVAEGDLGQTSATFDITLVDSDGVPLPTGSGEQVVVNWSVSNGTATGGEDFVVANGQVTFNPGETVKQVTIDVIGDLIPESDENFFVLLDLASNSNALIYDGVGEGTIIDEPDNEPTISINDIVYSPEGDSGVTYATFTVSLSHESGKTITVDVNSNDTLPATGAVEGSTNAGPIVITATGHGLRTGAVVTVYDVQGNTAANGTFTVTVIDADNFSLNGTIGNGAYTSGGTWAEQNRATAGLDFTSISETLTFNPGQTTRTVVVPILGDTIDEFDELLYLGLSNATNATIADNEGQGTLVDDDAGVQPTISIADATLPSEGNTGTQVLNFTVSLSQASGKTVTVDFATADGVTPTLIAEDENGEADYQSKVGTVVFNPGETSKTISITVNGDTRDEFNEEFFVNLSNAVNAAGIADAQALGTIIDDDPLASISINNASADEGADATFTVSLSAVSGKTITVDFTTLDGTAQDENGTADYVSNSGQITFLPGETSKTFTVSHSTDGIDEEDETYSVTLSNPTNALVGVASGTGTITDIDPFPFVDISDGVVIGPLTEGDVGTISVEFTISLSTVSGKVVSVGYTTRDGSALGGIDYVAATGVVTFQPGETTKKIQISIIGDTLDEFDENFFVDLFNVSATPSPWLAQGPGPIQDGQVENVAPNNSVVGAVHDVLTHPTNPDIMYLGTVNGGIWMTTNATDTNPTWIPVTDDMPSLSIGALEMDPADTDKLIAGIGRYSSMAQAGGPRVGILRSNDGGLTWTHISDPLLDNENISGVAMRGNLLLASSNFFGGGGGLFRSTNDGVSWTKISGTNGLPDAPIHDMVSDPTNPNRFYVTVQGDGVYRSNDAGLTWTNISNSDVSVGGIKDSFQNAIDNNNAEMAVASNGRLYVAVLDQGQPIYIGYSNNQGANWTAMDLPTTQESDSDIEGLSPTVKPGSQGAIHFSIVADPTDPNIVYVAGDRQDGPFPNFIGATNYTARIFRGDTTVTPTGATPSPQWEHVTNRNDVTAIPGGGTASNSSPHADSRDMAFDANGNLIEVDDGGVYRRTSPQDNTGDWYSINSNLQITEYHDIAYDSNSNVIIGGAQDTGTSYQLSPGSAVYGSISTADGGDVAVDDISSPGQSIRYSSYQNLGAFLRSTWDASNNLINAVYPALTVTGGGAALVPQFYTPIELNAIDPTRLIIGGANSVYESLDQGETIVEIGSGISANANSIAYGGMQGASVNLNVLYVGAGSEVYLRQTAGSALAPTFFPGGSVRGVTIDPNDWRHAFVIDNNQVFRTTNAGATWTDVTGDLVSSLGANDFRSIEFITNPVADAIAVGTQNGIYFATMLDLTTWEALATGIPNAAVYELDYDADDDVLIAGILGRGAWKLTNAGSAVNPPLSLNAIINDGEGEHTIIDDDQEVGISINDVSIDPEGDGVIANFNLGTPTNYGVNSDPRAIAVGDFDGINGLDIVVASDPGTVSVLLNDGAGGYGTATTFAAGTNAHDVIVADFNGDGVLDLATANFNGLANERVSILLGTGLGTFNAPLKFDAGLNPESLSAGDLNGDGILDLVVGNRFDPTNQISILLGNDDGFGSWDQTFTRSDMQVFGTGTGTRDVLLQDLDGNSTVDLVVVHDTLGVAVLSGNGDGTFGTATLLTAGTTPLAVATGDLDEDGNIDLVVANRNSSNVSLLLSNGFGGFGAATQLAVGNQPFSVTIGDFDGDNNLDIATSNYGSSNVSVLLGDGVGVFAAAQNFTTAAGPVSIVTADFNNDGRADLATANRSGNNVSVISNSPIFTGSTTLPLTFTISLDAPSAKTVTVDYATAGGTATADGDFVSATGTVTFNPGETSKTVTIDIIGDPIDEFDEQFTVNLSNPTFATIIDNQGVGTIIDDDPLPTLRIFDDIVIEGDTVEFTLKLSGPSEKPITVDFATQDGTAFFPGDYDVSVGTVTFNPGDTEKTITVNTLLDATDEFDETFDILLTNEQNVTLLNNQATATITDQDPPPTISIDDISVDEGGVLTFTVSLSTASEKTITVDFASADGTASDENGTNDYTSFSGTITFNPGETSHTIDIQSNDDTVDEFDEAFTIDLSNPVNATFADNQGLGTILDNDLEPTVTIDDVAIDTEGDYATPVFTGETIYATPDNYGRRIIHADFNKDGFEDLVVSHNTSSHVTLFLNNGDGTYAAGTSLTVGNNPNGMAAADVNKDGSIDLVVANEGSNTVSVLLGSGSGSFAPAIGFAAGNTPTDVVLADLDGDTWLDIAAANQQGNNVSILINQQDGSFGAPTNYATSFGPAYIAASDVNQDGRMDLIVGSVNRVAVLVQQTNGTFGPSVNYAPASLLGGIAVGDFNNDGYDDIVAAQFDGTNLYLLQNQQDGTFVLTSTPTVANKISAVHAVDITGDGNLDLLTGSTAASNVTLLQGAGDGTFIAPITQAFSTPVRDFVFTDMNGDTLGDIAVVTNTPGQIATIMSSGLLTPTADFTVTLSQASEKTITVDFATSAGTALADVDYNSLTGTITFNPGETSKTITIFGRVDVLDEFDENFFVDLSNPVEVTIADNQGEATIIDDDPLAVVSIDSVVVTEGDQATFTVSLSAPSGKPIVINFDTQNGTAVAPGDYDAESNTIAFAPGETTKTITIQTKLDGTDEYDETFDIVLSNLVNAAAGTLTGTATILDIDPLPEIAIDSVSIDEGGVATFTVTLLTASEKTVTVDYTTTDDVATDENSTNDYTSQIGTITFLPGETVHTIDIQTNDDTVDEFDETFFIDLLNPVEAVLQNAQGVGTILDNDLPPELSIDDVVIDPEGDLAIPLFGAEDVYATPNSAPHRVINVDFNKDGFQDLVVSHGGSSTTVAVYLNNGDGTFAAPTSLTSGTTPVGLAAADLDKDGNVDLVSANAGSNTVSVFFGNGDGTFLPAVNYGTSGGPTGVVLADIDGDTFLDIATANASGGNVSILINQQDTTFASAVNYASAFGAAYIAASDVNADGRIDLITTAVNKLQILIQQPNGTFAAPVSHQPGGQLGRVVAGDFNSDGFDDLAVATDAGTNLYLLLNQQDGTFAAPTTITMADPISSLLATDVTGDGRLDLLVGSSSGKSVTFLQGAGDGTFTSTNTETFTGDVDAFTFADLNNDTMGDLVVTDTTNAQMTVKLASSLLTPSADFTLTLTQASEKPITVDFATLGNTAVADVDFNSLTGTVTFNPGETTKTISIFDKVDVLDEFTERFFVDLSNPVNVTIVDSRGQAQIIDDDPIPEVSIDSVLVTEGDEAVFTVSLSAPSGKPIFVNFDTQDGTAVQPGDYDAASNTIAFAPGETTKTIRIQTKLDATDEFDETFDVSLSTLINVNAGVTVGTATILDVDPLPDITIDDVTVIEGEIASFTVSLSAASEKTVTVDFATSSGSASAPIDYASQMGTITFNPGETTFTVDIQTNDDIFDEFDQTFFIDLFNAVEGTIVDNQGLGTIQDNDPEPTITVNDIVIDPEGATGVGATGMPTFGPEIETTTSIPVSFFLPATSADLDNDTLVDLITVDGSDSFGVFLNDGTGLFATGTAVKVGDGVRTSSAAAGDLNNDGSVDVVILDDFSNTVYVLLGNGDGTFAAATSYAVGAGAYDVKLADLNGDLILDIVTANASTSSTVSLLYNNGDGTFGTAVDYSATATGLTSYLHVYAGDLNNDGRLDIVTSSTSAVAVLIQQSNGTFAAPVVYAHANLSAEAALGDFNSDGFLDIASVDTSTRQVQFWLNQGDGTFAVGTPVALPAFSLGTDRTQMIATDFDRDGSTDLIIGNKNGDDVYLVPGNGDGTFSAVTTIPVTTTISYDHVFFMDVDNDGREDLTFVDGAATQIVTMFGTGAVAPISSFTVTLSAPSEKTITVDYATTMGTALDPDDYAGAAGTLTFNPGQTSLTVDIATVDDLLDEFDEDFFIDLSNPTNATIADAQGHGTIIDDDPLVQISIDDVVVNESDGTATFTVTLDSASGKTVSVDYNVGEDSQATPPDSFSNLVDIFLLFDDTGSFSGVAPTLASAFSTVITDLQASLPGANLAFGVGRFEEYGGGFADGSDSDSARPFILNQPLISPFNTEFAAAIDAALNRTTPGGGGDGPETAIEALYQVATGLGFDGNNDGDTVDSGAAGLYTTQTTPGDTGDVPRFNTFTADATGDPNGPILAPIGTNGGAGFRDGSIRLVLLATDTGFVYQADTRTAYVGLGGVTVNADDIKTGGRDTTPDDNGAQIQQTINALVAQGIQVIGLGTNGSLSAQPRMGLEAISTLTGAINATGVSIDGGVAGDPIDPGDPLYFQIDTGSGASLANAITQAVAAAVGDIAASATDDFVAANGQLVFAPGEITKTITVNITDDLIDEFDEVFKVELSNAINATINPDGGQGTIIDDDAPPTVSIDDVTVTEGGFGNVNPTYATFTLTLSEASQKPVTVQFTTVDGSAQDENGTNDYQSLFGSVTFMPGETTKTIDVRINPDYPADSVYEGDENFFVNLTSVINADIADNQGEGTIIDRTAPPQIAVYDLTIDPETNSSPRTVTLQATMNRQSVLPTSFDFKTTSGTAIAGADFTAKSGTLTFAPGQTSLFFTVDVTGDTLKEDNEIFYLDFSNPVDGTLLNNRVQLLIVDDDPFPTMAITDVTKTEGDNGVTKFDFTVSLATNFTSQTVTVDYATAPGTAVAGSDYVSQTGTLTFAPGVRSQVISIDVYGDLLNEFDDTFFINLSNPVNVVLSDSQGKGTIVNDDPLPTVTVNDIVVDPEGDSGVHNATFTVTLSEASGVPIKLDYYTISFPPFDGTAEAGADYTPVAGTITLAPGVTSHTINVPILTDTIKELDETFFLNISNPVNVVISDAEGQATIIDDDIVPAFSIDDVTIQPGVDGSSTTATFTVSLSGPSGQTSTVDFSTADGSAVVDEDYTAVNGTLTFAPGATTQTVVVPILGNISSEFTENFFVNLSNASGATILDAQGEGTIGGNTVNFQGTTLHDTFTVVLGDTTHAVTLNSNPTVYLDATQIKYINYDGLAGNDLISITGTDADDTARIRSLTNGTLTGEVSFISSKYEVRGTNTESITTYGRGGNDTAFYTDSIGDDMFVAAPTTSRMTTSGLYFLANQFENVTATASMGGTDIAHLHDSAGDDSYVASPTTARLTGTGFYNVATGFDEVNGYSLNGGNDTAYLHDSAGNDFFIANTTNARLFGTDVNFFNRAFYFDVYNGFAINGGVDEAYLYDSADNDTFNATVTQGTMTTPNVSIVANQFDRVFANSINGGNDTATLYDSAGDDTFWTTPFSSRLVGTNFFNSAIGFDAVTAEAINGGYDFGEFVDSIGDDVFVSNTTTSRMSGSGFLNTANGFDSIYAHSTIGGNDVANMHDSAGDDVFSASPTSARMTSSTVTNRADGFKTVNGYALNGGTDSASLFDSAGDDSFVSSATSSRMTGTGYLLTAASFETTIGYALNGGTDLATLFDSTGSDQFISSPTNSRFVTGNITRSAQRFEQVIAQSGNGGSDTAYLYGSAGDDTLTAGLTSARLTGTGFDVTTSGFATMYAYGNGGTNDRAVFQNVNTNDTVYGRTNYLLAKRSGKLQRAYDFDTVRAEAAAGNTPTADVANLDFVFEQVGNWL